MFCRNLLEARLLASNSPMVAFVGPGGVGFDVAGAVDVHEVASSSEKGVIVCVETAQRRQTGGARHFF